MKKINLSWILITLMIAAFLIGYGKMNTGGALFKGFGSQKAKETAQKAIDYINKNFLENGGAVLVSVFEESGVYKFKMEAGGSEYDSYLTKDGKILFPDGIKILEEETTTTTEAKKMTCDELKKTKTPALEVFVVSQCPFGLQMQRVINEIVRNIPELDDYIEVKYMGEIKGGKIIAMHGDEEAQENLRQICIREEQKEKYWEYIGCYIKEGKINECLDLAKIDTSKLNGCINDNTRGIKYAQKDFDAQNKYKVTGSPTLILNEENVAEFDFGGRTAEAVKTVLCCGFQSQPNVCSQKLTEDSAETGFSSVYSSGSVKGDDASCN